MNRRGTVLLAVLVMTAMAAIVAAGLLFRMQAETYAAANSADGQQAYAAAMSGLRGVADLLATHGGDPAIWSDNPRMLRNQFVCSDGANDWYFSVYAHNPEDESTVRYGATDESGKINLNMAEEPALLKLPGMTNELAACLLDYRDADDAPRDNGAEQDWYDQRTFPYLIKNGPLATVEELLLVKGFTGPLVYGEDVNFNGLLDVGEDDGDARFPYFDDGDGQLDRGLRAVTTVYSYHPNLSDGGEPRIDLNGDRKGLADLGLPRQTVEFIEMYRKEGGKFVHPSQLLNMTYQPGNQAAQGDRRGGPPPGRGWRRRTNGGRIASGVGAEQLPIVVDRLMAGTGGGRAAGRFGPVNVNTASVEVLAAALAPVLGEDASPTAQRIVDTRGGLPAENRTTTAWLYTEQVVDADTFKKIAPLLEAKGYQYRVQCVGFGLPSGRFRVLEAVVDLARGTPRILYLRDITRLGRPFPLDVTQEEFIR